MEDLMMADISKAIPKGLKPFKNETKNTVVLTDLESNKTIKWSDFSIRNNSYGLKSSKEWNKKDIVKYWFDKYYDKYGVTPGNIHAWAINYKVLAEIEFMISKILEIDCNIPMIKFYFDWLFDFNLIDNAVLLSKGKANSVTFAFARSEKFILKFKIFVKQQPENIINDILGIKTPIKIENTAAIKETSVIKVSSIETAYKISGQYLLEEFGVYIPIVYLINYKNKDLSFALEYVKKILNKVKDKKDTINNIITSTKKYSPYPLWIPGLNENELVSLCEVKTQNDNDNFKELKEIKK